MDKGKIKSLKAQIEIATIAVGREKKARDFYLDASEVAYDEESRNLFLVLADEEKQHLEKMTALLSSVQQKYNEELSRM